MYALDFEYDDFSSGKIPRKLSDLGFTICNFDGGGDLETISAGSKITFNKVSMNHGRHSPLISTSYDECLECTFDICKDPQLSQSQSITRDEKQTIMRWLSCKSFKDIKFSSSNNLLILPYNNNFTDSSPVEGKVTSNGVTFEPNSDGSISIWGTATDKVIYNLRNYQPSSDYVDTTRIPLRKGTYTVGLYADGLKSSNASCVRVVTNIYNSTPIYLDHPATVNLVEDTYATYKLQITTGFDISKSSPVKIYPMINLGECLKPYDVPENEQSYCYYKGSFNIEEVRYQDILYGFRLNLTTDKPFGYGKKIKITEYNLKNRNPIRLKIKTDEVGEVPVKMTIACKFNGDIWIRTRLDRDIYNPITNFKIKNCSSGETICIDSINQIITTSSSTHKIYNDFDYIFPVFLREWDSESANSESVFVVINNSADTTLIVGDITIEYTPIIKGSIE